MSDPLNRLIGALLLLLVQPAMAEPSMQETDGRGPYEGVAASENTVWVLDTRTGKVSKCVQDFADQPPKCSAFSK
jgi:hypothetical protein